MSKDDLKRMADYFQQIQSQFKHKLSGQTAQNEQIYGYIKDLERNNLAKMNAFRYQMSKDVLPLKSG